MNDGDDCKLINWEEQMTDELDLSKNAISTSFDRSLFNHFASGQDISLISN